MVKDVFLATRVHKELKRVAEQEAVSMQELANMLLSLSLADERMVKQAVNMANITGLKSIEHWKP